jgi:flagellar motor protein MotB
MMQLVCLFILLYSVSSLDKDKMALVAAYYRASVGLGEPPIHEPASQGRNLAVGDRPLVGGRGGRTEIPPDVQYKVDSVPGGWMVHFDRPIFEPGSAVLAPGIARQIDTIAERFRAYAGQAFVTATAAPEPVDGMDTDPMKLAQARAEAVAARLTRDGAPGAFDPRFLQASGKVVAAADSRRAEIFVQVR